jgi:DNA (cytosine-5)-methyltransferase 1
MLAVDLFAGPGGWDQAALNIKGLETIGFEWDERAVKTRIAAGHATMHGDVASFDPLDKRWSRARGLIASPPCQTFSTAGSGAGRAEMDRVLAAVRSRDLEAQFSDSRTALILEPLRWILARQEAGRPYRWVALEQVPTCLPIWEAYADVLRELGYSVAVGNLQAEQYGVPSTRKRAILVASLDRKVSLPEPTHSRYYAKDPKRMDEGVLPWVSMADALDGLVVDLPAPTKGAIREWFQPTSATREQAAEWELYLSKFVHRTGRPMDRPAQTLNFGHAAPNSRFEGPNGEAQRIAVPHAGVLQSFPFDYPWSGPQGGQYLQVANAIPPLLAEAVLRQVVK